MASASQVEQALSQSKEVVTLNCCSSFSGVFSPCMGHFPLLRPTWYDSSSFLNMNRNAVKCPRIRFPCFALSRSLLLVQLGFFWSFISLCPASWIKEKTLKTHDVTSCQLEIYNGVGHETKKFHNNNFYLVCFPNSWFCQLFSSLLKQTEFHCFPVSSEMPWDKLESSCFSHNRGRAARQGSRTSPYSTPATVGLLLPVG